MTETSSTLKNLGEKYNTDKITHHGYHRFYDLFLDFRREKIKTMLEIGVEYGGSLSLWSEYFPNAFIFGIDKNLSPNLKYPQNRIRLYEGDQSNESDLDNIAEDIVQFLRINNKGTDKLDFIIDDGSHVPDHQILTFAKYFSDLLSDGGIYIIEDIEVGYWVNEKLYGYPINYGYKHKDSLVEVSKSLVDSINKEFLSSENKNQLTTKIAPEVQDMISSITFGQNCIIFKKKSKEEYNYTNREYRFNYRVKKT